jgi:hypothetical protein
MAAADAPAASARPEAQVRRRHVLYLSGFDPNGPARYHAMYAEEAARQAAVSGYRITVGARQRTGAHASSWDVAWESDGGSSVTTRYEFLRWDDIVREHWPRGQVRLLATTWWTTAQLIRGGALWRILQTSWPAFLALAAPGLWMVATAVGGITALALSASLVAAGQAVAGGLCAVGGLSGLWALGRWAQARLQMAWLMRSAQVIVHQARGDIPALDERLDAFTGRLIELAGSPDIDELLVVGHSSGAMLAVSIVARALAREPALMAQPAAPALLTLGQCIPVLSYQPEATRFRAELATLRHAHQLTWIDVTAPPDGCCFALIDPTEVCEDGIAAEQRHEGGPKRLSPRFAQLFHEARYHEIRSDKYRCHFQYLMAGEIRSDYDYFAVTAGPVSLASRYASVPSVTGFVQFQRFGGPRR